MSNPSQSKKSSPPRIIVVQVLDRDKRPLAGATVEQYIDGEKRATVKLGTRVARFEVSPPNAQTKFVAYYEDHREEKVPTTYSNECVFNFDDFPRTSSEETKPENSGNGNAAPTRNKLSPLSILNIARQAVPAVDYALGVAGIAAACAIVIGFLGNGRATIIIVGVMLVAMLLLFIFAQLVSAKDPSVIRAGKFLLWVVLLFFSTFLLFTITAVAFGWPSAWGRILNVVPDPLPIPETTTWQGMLTTGMGKSIPFNRSRGGVVQVSLESLQPDYTEWSGPKGALGHDGLLVTICGSSDTTCGKRNTPSEYQQRGARGKISRDVADASGYVAISNFSDSPKKIIELSITYTK